MPAHRVGRLWTVLVTEVDAWVRRLGADEAARTGVDERESSTTSLGDDLKGEVTPGSKVRVAAFTLSIVAFEELSRELEHEGGLEFAFTAPSFVTEKVTDEIREDRR